MDHNQNKFEFIVFIELTAFVYIDDDTKNLILSHLRVGRSSVKKDAHKCNERWKRVRVCACVCVTVQKLVPHARQQHPKSRSKRMDGRMKYYRCRNCAIGWKQPTHWNDFRKMSTCESGRRVWYKGYIHDAHNGIQIIMRHIIAITYNQLILFWLLSHFSFVHRSTNTNNYYMCFFFVVVCVSSGTFWPFIKYPISF